jgi:hypothetical protein
MAKKKQKKTLRDELEDQVMIGVDGKERAVLDCFRESDFDKSRDGKEIFVRHDGLLRAAKLAFGGIKRRIPVVKGVPNQENDWCAVVSMTYVFGNKIRIGDVGDCRSKTANPGFKNYTTALAATRASARALRFALGLETVAFEEVTNVEDLVDTSDREPALEGQKKLIKKRFMKEHGKTFEDISNILNRKVVTLDQLTRGNAKEVLEVFNSK